jgi:hypothetical protein
LGWFDTRSSIPANFDALDNRSEFIIDITRDVITIFMVYVFDPDVVVAGMRSSTEAFAPSLLAVLDHR